MKKLLSAILSVCFILSLMNTTVFAAKKENLFDTFSYLFYAFPSKTGDHVLSEDYFWVRENSVEIKENCVFPADVVVEYSKIRYSLDNFTSNYDEEKNLFTVPKAEFEDFAKSFFNKIDEENLQNVTYIDNSGSEVLRPKYFNGKNYVFKGLGAMGGGYGWYTQGYYDLGNDKYEVYLCYTLPEEPISDTIAKSVVTYIDKQLKFYSFEKANAIPDDLITADTVFEDESSKDSATSEDASSKDDDTGSKETSSNKTSGLASSKESKPNTESKNQGNTSSKNSGTSNSSKNESANLASSTASKNTSNKTTLTSSKTESSANGDVSNGISVSLGSERDDSSAETSSKTESTTETKTFAEIENAKIDAAVSVFPENTIVEISEIIEGDTFNAIEKTLKNKASKWNAFDISAKNNNVSVQPNGTVTLTLSIPDDFDLSLLEIWFISDSGEIEVIPSVINNMEKTVTAELSHFSSYVMVENAVTEEISFSSNGETKENSEKDSGNNIVWIIISIVVVLLIAGACVWYFLFFKKKQNAN